MEGECLWLFTVCREKETEWRDKILFGVFPSAIEIPKRCASIFTYFLILFQIPECTVFACVLGVLFIHFWCFSVFCLLFRSHQVALDFVKLYRTQLSLGMLQWNLVVPFLCFIFLSFLLLPLSTLVTHPSSLLLSSFLSLPPSLPDILYSNKMRVCALFILFIALVAPTINAACPSASYVDSYTSLPAAPVFPTNYAPAGVIPAVTALNPLTQNHWSETANLAAYRPPKVPKYSFFFIYFPPSTFVIHAITSIKWRGFKPRVSPWTSLSFLHYLQINFLTIFLDHARCQSCTDQLSPLANGTKELARPRNMGRIGSGQWSKHQHPRKHECACFFLQYRSGFRFWRDQHPGDLQADLWGCRH